MWEDMLVKTTVEHVRAKEVLVRSTGHEKARVTVCLTAKADGSKLKPFKFSKGLKER